MEIVSSILLAILVITLPYLRSTFFGVYNKASETNITKRYPYFDVLRGIAILAVIWIHTRRAFETLGPIYDPAFLFVSNNITRFAIPFFLICSGVLLNPESARKGLRIFFGKKFFRSGVPYILATTAIVMLADRLDLLFSSLLNGTAQVPYYFMIVLFQCYLLYPLMVKAGQYKRILLYGSFFLSLLSFMYPDSWAYGEFPLVTKFLFFFVYGFVKREDFLKFVPRKKDLVVWSAITILYLSMTLTKPELYYNVRLFYGIALFNLLFFLKPALEKAKYIFTPLLTLGKNSLWIYLIHYPITFAAYNHLQTASPNYYVNITLVFLVATIITIPLAWICGRLYGYVLRLAQ